MPAIAKLTINQRNTHHQRQDPNIPLYFDKKSPLTRHMFVIAIYYYH